MVGIQAKFVQGIEGRREKKRREKNKEGGKEERRKEGRKQVFCGRVKSCKEE